MTTNNNGIENIDYSMPFLKSKRFLIIIISIFTLTLLSGFSITNKVDSVIAQVLNANPRCPITMSNYEFKFFLPRVEINNISIPNHCVGSTGTDLRIKKLNLYFRGFSFSPLGPHFKLETTVNKNPLTAYITMGISNTLIRLTDNTLSLQNFKDFIPMVKLKGDIKLDALINLVNFKLDTLMLNARSNNFKIPSQNIMMLNIMQLNIDHLKLIIDTDKPSSNIKIKEFILGKEGSAVELNLKGNLKLNQRKLTQSLLRLAGELKVSPDVVTKYPLIKIFLDSFDKKDDYYQVEVSGPLSRPNMIKRR